MYLKPFPDTFISLEEFINYKNKTVHLASTDDGKQQIILQFRSIDLDQDGRLNWWEFVSHDAKLLIAKRSTVGILLVNQNECIETIDPVCLLIFFHL
jgi:hypothetical protein